MTCLHTRELACFILQGVPTKLVKLKDTNGLPHQVQRYWKLENCTFFQYFYGFSWIWFDYCIFQLNLIILLKYPQKLHEFSIILCLSVCLSWCLSVCVQKRQNGWTNRARILRGTSHDPRKVYGCSDFQFFWFLWNFKI